MSKLTELKIPDLGDFSDVEVIELLVAVGDSVDVEDGVLTLETDKAAMDVPAPLAGRIAELRVAAGDRVNEGDVYAVIETDEAAAAHDEPADAAVGRDDGDDDRFGRTEVLLDEFGAPADPGAAPAAAPDAAPGASALREVVVPDLGDFSDVDVIDVLVAPGDRVEVESGLISLETDKAAMDVPSPFAGVVRELRVTAGDKVSEGDIVAVIESAAAERTEAAAPPPREQAPAPESASAKPASAKAPEAPAAAAPPARAAIDEAGFSRAHASPSVRKLARELGVNLIDVKGSGRKGRILHEDVKAWVKSALTAGPKAGAAAALPGVPAVDFARFGEIELQPLSRIQKISGPRLQASWINVPHVTQHDLADITGLEARRQELKGPARETGINLTPLAFVIRAVVLTLQEQPTFASSLSADGENLVMKRYCHIGFAADTPNGLVVPVIRDADRRDVYELAGELGELSALAREGKLKIDQMQGAVFTISSLGGIGGTAFTPIVNAPEVAILGVSRAAMQPVWNGSEFEPRLMLPLSLSYDHRVIDGAAAVRFTTRLGELLGDVGRLLEALP